MRLNKNLSLFRCDVKRRGTQGWLCFCFFVSLFERETSCGCVARGWLWRRSFGFVVFFQRPLVTSTWFLVCGDLKDGTKRNTIWWIGFTSAHTDLYNFDQEFKNFFGYIIYRIVVVTCPCPLSQRPLEDHTGRTSLH